MLNSGDGNGISKDNFQDSEPVRYIYNGVDLTKWEWTDYLWVHKLLGNSPLLHLQQVAWIPCPTMEIGPDNNLSSIGLRMLRQYFLWSRQKMASMRINFRNCLFMKSLFKYFSRLSFENQTSEPIFFNQNYKRKLLTI